MNSLRRVADTGPWRRILLSRRVRRFVAWILMARFAPAALQIREPVRFLARSARGRGSATYHVRGSDMSIIVRHDAGGLELVNDIFRNRCYDPPAPLADLLPSRLNVLDVGANVGAFSVFAALRWPKCRITAIEPDPDNLRELTRVRALNRLDFQVVPMCASVSDQLVPFCSGRGQASRIEDGGAPTRAMDLLPMLQSVDLVKLDIEGGEWAILSDPRLASVKRLVVVLEYHPEYSPSSVPSDAARQMLGAAGFSVGYERSNYWGHGMLWAWKTEASQPHNLT